MDREILSRVLVTDLLLHGGELVFVDNVVTAARHNGATAIILREKELESEALARLASLEGEKEWGAEFQKMHSARPVANAVVVLRSGPVSMQTQTDSEGKFKFTDLPSGGYELSSEWLARPSLTGMERTFVAKTQVRVDRYHRIRPVTL